MLLFPSLLNRQGMCYIKDDVLITLINLVLGNAFHTYIPTYIHTHMYIYIDKDVE